MKTCNKLAVVCLAAGLLAAQGCVYMHVQHPLGSDFNQTQLGAKEGRSNSYSVLWMVAWGDAGTKAAAAQGGIQTIRHADTEIKSVLLGCYVRVTTVVYGD